ncbi:MAG: hypothetical protein OEZ19_03030 [Paracoccaceae bacterium]|nr:hypothetical protein [Paracoccaceae bacterium]
MTRNNVTPTPNLDQILMRGGYPVKDPEWLRVERRNWMHVQRAGFCSRMAILLKSLGEWFDAYAESKTT